MNKRKNSPPALAAPAGGRQLDAAGVVVMNSSIVPRGGSQVNTLARLREQYNQAVLAEDFERARQPQRAYRQAERQRRRELLEQAQGVRDG